MPNHLQANDVKLICVVSLSWQDVGCPKCMSSSGKVIS